MHTTILITMRWWDQGGKSPRFPPLVSWISQGDSSLVDSSILFILVLLISVCPGLVSDFAKNKYGIPRSYCLVLVAVMFFVSQVAAGSINNINHLWIASALLGLAYGSVFSLFPTICLEWFGMRKCRFNPHSFKILNVGFQRTFLRTGVISLCRLWWLVTSFLSCLGGSLTRTTVLEASIL